MNKKNQNLSLAIVVLILVSLACNALFPTPGVSNFYMAKDSEGNDRTTIFSPSDDFYIFFDVSEIEVGTKFEAEWFALNIEGQDSNTPFQTIDYDYEEGFSSIYFQLFNNDGWPVGDYRVDVYMEGVKVGEQSFSVQ